jgi:hypothetical protein
MDVEDEFIKCPHCKSLMTQEKVFLPEDPVNFDYNCKACRDTNEKHLAIATSGGAGVVCPACHTTGTLPATDKQVIKFRKENNIGPEVEVRFLLVETQCPRCADMQVERAFTESESNRVLLHEADLENGFHRKPVQGEKSKKEAKPNAKKSKKPVVVVGDPAPKEDEVPVAPKGVFFAHPGSKTFN